MKNKFDVDYFINKFEAIPEDKWLIGKLTSDNDPDCHCVLGHCGLQNLDIIEALNNDEVCSLVSLFNGDVTSYTIELSKVYEINDNKYYFWNNPKERILNKLKEIKEKK